jgi:hypothetical protein
MKAQSMVMEQIGRILTAIFWVAALLLIASLVVAFLSYDFMVGLLSEEGLEVVNAVLMGTVVVCLGLIAWQEFRANPAEEAEYGECRRGGWPSTPQSSASPSSCRFSSSRWCSSTLLEVSERPYSPECLKEGVFSDR